MNNNNTDLFKILLLSEYDIDYEKSSFVILEGGSTIIYTTKYIIFQLALERAIVMLSF